MTIKELETELGIPRATIRFYERQELIHPKRMENSYRDYSAEDAAVLKKIIIFRKLGLSMSEIEDLFDGTTDLPDSIQRNIAELKKQIEELNGALEVCKEIEKKKEVMSTFDEQFYWDEIHREEKAGQRFLDITGDLIKYEKDDVMETLSATDSEGNPRHSKRTSVLKTVLLILACGGIAFLLENYRIKAFFMGALTPLIFLLILTVFECFSFFLKDIRPTGAKWMQKIGYAAAAIGMFAYITGFFGLTIRQLICDAKENIETLTMAAVGFGITAWGFVYHIFEIRLIFDRRHVTGVNSFYVIVVGGLISGYMLLSYSKEACISYILLLIMIYQLIEHFIERKEYPEEERFKKPGA
ncbi:MAG TPA: hypothetical protein DF613_05525 [Lachnospiraceae bacterium]|nr:hypothetical protein [Lachnospiraceae bacterium]